MASKSKIEWTQITWNFITGCTKVSDGCVNCYIERTPPFRMAGRKFDKPGIGGATGVKLHADRLHWPITKWRKPSLIFVNSLADLFHEDVPDEFIAKAFAVMRASPQHNFQLLTKRHARMRNLLRTLRFEGMVVEAALGLGMPYATEPWPLPNAWIGVSVENQQWADIRIPALLETPAAVRWISAEPLLGPVELKTSHCRTHDFSGGFCTFSCPERQRLDWVVCGGESGPCARPMEPAWAESLVGQCQAANIPVFVKQLGSRWGKNHHDIDAFPEALRVREYPQVVSA